MTIREVELHTLLQEYINENEDQLESDNFLVGQDITIHQLVACFNDLLKYAHYLGGEKVSPVDTNCLQVATLIKEEEC